MMKEIMTEKTSENVSVVKLTGKQVLQKFEYLAAKKYELDGKMWLSFAPKTMLQSWKNHGQASYERSC